MFRQQAMAVAAGQQLLEQRPRFVATIQCREGIDVPEGADQKRILGLAEIVLLDIAKNEIAVAQVFLDGIYGRGKARIGGIKEANAGGRTGLHMTHMGIHALIIEDQPKDEGYWVLHLSLNGAKWEKADEVVGLGVYETASRLVEKHGDKVAIALIGPGGEMRMKSAGIQNLDKDRVPARIAARGGLGAVMGSKGLKAIVFDHTGGQKPSIVDPQAFKIAQKD